MFALESVSIPIVAAPMAGGPSTPELVVAVGGAGGIGVLAAGYKSAAAVADEIAAVRAMSDRPFGVNLFVPAAAHAAERVVDAGERDRRSGLVETYKRSLAADAERYQVALPTTDPADTDEWDEKIEVLTRAQVPVVSFTFGCPDRAVIARLHGVGTFVIISVTDADEARLATAHGADGLCVQGPLGGGHRPTHCVEKTPGTEDLSTLLANIRAVTGLPLVAAGGITRPEHIAEALAAGGVAVQLGTAFLRSPESGASPLHKNALASAEFTETAVTRAFSGRCARGLTNRFIREHDEQAPAAYPEVNQLVRPLRAAAAKIGDPHGVALWAGTRFRDATTEPAAAIVARLWEGAQRLRAS